LGAAGYVLAFPGAVHKVQVAVEALTTGFELLSGGLEVVFATAYGQAEGEPATG
jgi:hypothetical protein